MKSGLNAQLPTIVNKAENELICYLRLVNYLQYKQVNVCHYNGRPFIIIIAFKIRQHTPPNCFYRYAILHHIDLFDYTQTIQILLKIK